MYQPVHIINNISIALINRWYIHWYIIELVMSSATIDFQISTKFAYTKLFPATPSDRSANDLKNKLDTEVGWTYINLRKIAMVSLRECRWKFAWVILGGTQIEKGV